MPGLVVRVWAGGPATPASKTFARALCGRNLAIGAWTVMNIHNMRTLQGWLRAGAFADAIDGLTILSAYRHLPKSRRDLILLMAAGSAAAGWSASLKPAGSR